MTISKRTALRRAASLLLALLLSVCLCVPALAAEDTLTISTAEQLKSFAASCAYDAWSKGLTVVLDSDIDMKGEALSVPIFLGTFDGQGHKITNVKLTDSASGYGVFSRIAQSGTVKNLTVSGDMTPSGTQSYIGGIAGYNYGIIRNCRFSGTVTGGDIVGGIAGYNGDTGVIDQCGTDGTVQSTSATGGIAGQNYGTIRSCTSSMAVDTQVNDSDAPAADLESTLYSLLKGQQTAETGANTDAGGIAGYSTGTIENCTNTGTVGYPHVGYNVGGIVGRQDGLVSGCTNTGSVQGRKDVGGIVGQMIPDITIQAGPDRVAQLRGELETLTDLTERTTNDVSDTSDMVTDRVSRINKYANSAETTVSDLVGQLREDMTIEEFQEWLQKVGESSDSIHGDLSGIGNEMDGLTSGLVSANKTLSADLRAVNDQLNSTMNLFLTLVDEVTTGSGDVTKDVSEDTLYSAKRGKAVDCVNRGTVEGDRNVGGIAGALAIEYDYDREDDLLPSGSRTVKYTYLTRAILLDCDNYGAVTAKKSCAGSVAGRMDLGTVYGCGGWGDTQVESGDYVGGVVGLSLTSVRHSWAKCTLSGGSYVGGITGSGSTVTDCIAMPEIISATQFSGGIAGEITNTCSGDLFVSDTLAGIDRVSYQGKAEPVTYDQLLARTDIPEDFRTLTLRFVADGDVLKKLTFDYGASFGDDVFPAAPEKEDCYVRWDKTDLTGLHFDTTVTAVYEPYITALSWSGSGDETAQPALLAEGKFRDGDRLQAAETDFPSELTGEPVTAMRVTIPDDAADSHTIRWLLPEDAPRRMLVYVSTGDGWTAVPHDTAGSYLRFAMDGSGRFAVVRDESIPLWVWFVSGGGAALAIAAVLALHHLRKKKKVQT